MKVINNEKHPPFMESYFQFFLFLSCTEMAFYNFCSPLMLLNVSKNRASSWIWKGRYFSRALGRLFGAPSYSS